VTRHEGLSETAQQDRAGQILWAIIDGQAIPGSHGRAVRLLGSRAVARQALAQRESLDSRLRAWASPEVLSAQRADLPTHSPLLARLIHAPLQRIVAPSAALGVGLFLVALRFRLDGLHEAISTLVERWRGL
jgi:hypothetical protein